VMSIVAIDDFCGPQAEKRLGDLGWVSERALRHQRVIERGFRRGPILPARFGTLFSSLDALERFIECNQRTIVDFFDEVRGHEEWGIKALLERSTARKSLIDEFAASAAGPAPAPAGLRYLQERRAQAAAEKALHRWLLSSCDSVAKSLDEFAADRRQRNIVDPSIPGDPRELVLNLATLVPQDRVKDLLTHIEDVNAQYVGQGLTFVPNGPWPPYNFCPPLAEP
jgi:gas vesicle protein GvpL/GvpF